MANGYEKIVKDGGDIKRGYVLKAGVDKKVKTTTFVFKPFVREEKNEIAALLLVIKIDRFNLKTTYYLCIPRNSPELSERFVKELGEKGDIALIKQYVQASSEALGDIF